jgi:hypothetical protein
MEQQYTGTNWEKIADILTQNEKDKEQNEKIEDQNKKIQDLIAKSEVAQHKKKEEITLAQQLLLLHYLDLLNKIDLTTKSKSELLSKVLNRSMDNIRKNVTYINSGRISDSKIKNVENLELVLNIFNELKMLEVADKVKVDLDKINKIK